MIIKKAAACGMVLMLLLIWGWQENRQSEQIRYTDLQETDSPDNEVRIMHTLPQYNRLYVQEARPFRPREYVRIIRFRPEE
ncbi:hypothetical protein [Paenibacillus tarimensis]|uniref:hypothetical protein n=1 Tax=Paenibacillus tarimensis TaxID=416012 RepID=UPI001F3E731C|nr:hypothetical protein [Paenibacillus tarimensis]MCF2944666.1 hypothetical protein [Paenibacillus tarimensis]